MKLLIVGGVAGGATAAARARRLSETATIIMFERDEYISFANCGLPYHLSGEIPKRESLLVQTKAGLAQRYNLDIRTRHEVLAIDPAKKQVRVLDREKNQEYFETYDSLLLSPGAAPLLPPIAGTGCAGVYVLRNMDHLDQIKSALDAGANRAVIVGGGFIGLEVAENLIHRGLSVAVVEMLPQVMPNLDPEIAERIRLELVRHGISLKLGTGASAIHQSDQGLLVSLTNGEQLAADIVIMAVGVRPESKLAKDAGLNLSERGAIVVDRHLRTSDLNIYAVGDAVQVDEPVLGGRVVVPLAGPANRQARVAVDNIFGRKMVYRGAQGTSIVKLFGLTAAATGASEKALKAAKLAYKKVYIQRAQHVGYYPGAQNMLLKLLFSPENGRILGAQIVGGEGVDKRIDILATAIFGGMEVYDLEELELAYSPQFGAAKDPINIAGNVAVNFLTGEEDFISPEDFGPEVRDKWTILDVREVSEYEAGHIPNAMLIPLGQLRNRWQEIPTDRPLAVYCGVAQRAYYATRILRAHGIKPKNIAGGFSLWPLFYPQ